MYKPKFKLGQRVVCIVPNSNIKTYGIIVGIRLYRKNAGSGGMLIYEIEKKGFSKAYLDDTSTAKYTVVIDYRDGISSTADYMEKELLDINKVN